MNHRPKIVSIRRRDTEDVLARNIIIEIQKGLSTESWEVELSPYEAEKLLNKLEALVGCYDRL